MSEQESAPTVTAIERQFIDDLQRFCRSRGYAVDIFAATGHKYNNAAFMVLAMSLRESEANHVSQRSALLQMSEEALQRVGKLPADHALRRGLVIRSPGNYPTADEEDE